MERDPFYREIVKRLNERQDGNLFEECVTDLLSEIYPTLVPVRGGSDAGMDGAIADGQGEPFTLVVTTEKDVIGNLTHNLTTNKEKHQRRKALLVTSRNLNPPGKRQLYRRARELGFTLINIHDQPAIANLLYRNPRWCLKLWNLPGNPSALSKIPKSTRIQLSQRLIGQEEAFNWLRERRSDTILVGQPAAGKTALLKHLVDVEEGAYFVVSADSTEIASEIRAKRPVTLIVDDAHIQRDLFETLRYLRYDIGANFTIVASTWPSYQQAISRILNLTRTDVYHLELLTRDQIVEIIRGAGLGGPDGLIQEIVNQAEGRPGLAATLAHLSLVSGVQDIVAGEAIHQLMLEVFETLALKQHSAAILAAFALGGTRGLSIDVVSQAFGIHFLEVREIVTQLYDSGIVFDALPENISIRPAALRHVLVRDEFFSGRPSALSPDALLQHANIDDLLSTLIGAYARGAHIPDARFHVLLPLTSSGDVWHEYSRLGRRQSEWALENCPTMLLSIAPAALRNTPEKVIPKLLEKAIGDDRLLHANPEHPLRLIQDWIQGAPTLQAGAVKRRGQLLVAIQTWVAQGKDISVALRALQQVVSPFFEYVHPVPGSGMTVQISDGIVDLDSLIEIGHLWEQVKAILLSIEIDHWEPIQEIANMWAYWSPQRVNIPDVMRERLGATAKQILQDVVEIASGKPGILLWAEQLAVQTGIDIDLEVSPDSDFKILFPQPDHEDWRAAQIKQAVEVKALAEDWVRRSPTEVAIRIALIEKEMQSIGRNYLRRTDVLCANLATMTDKPEEWLSAMVQASVPVDLVLPFLQRMVNTDHPNWMSWTHQCLDDQRFRTIAVTVVLQHPSPPAELLDKTVSQLDGFSKSVCIMCSRGQVPEATVGRLLSHPDPQIASAAAEGEWTAHPKNSVRTSLYPQWRTIVVNAKGDEDYLREVFEQDPSIAADWLARYCERAEYDLLHTRWVVSFAVNVVDVNTRKNLLGMVRHSFDSPELIELLVDDELDLYEHLLQLGQPDSHRLAPLSCEEIDAVWIQKAILALRHNISPERVSTAIWKTSGMNVEWWSGDSSNIWQKRIIEYDKLCNHEHPGIREVGEIGKAHAIIQRDRELAKERREAVFGDRD